MKTVDNNSGLTFNALRDANKRRIPLFKNRRGGPAYTKPDGSDWKLSQWSNAVFGEVGEAANFIKKWERGDFDDDQWSSVKADIAKELADAVIYIDILAFQCGINLGDVVAGKFNEVSRRIDCSVFLDATIDPAEIVKE
jgi:NTP pyrophosphatase (non-canonical NTP hydrolase)